MSPLHRFALLWVALTPVALAGEAPASNFLQGLAGDWRGTGVVQEMPADIRMTWEAALDGQFTRLTLDNRMTGSEGKTWHFKSQAYYQVLKDGTIAGHWFDSNGASLPVTGEVEGDAMIILWGTETSPERGRSTYRLSAGELVVTDEVFARDRGYRVFGRTRLMRQAP